jgi:hypothetical protein
MQEAADRLVVLLREIEDDGILVMTEDCGTIFLMRGRPNEQEFADINDHAGKWAVE